MIEMNSHHHQQTAKIYTFPSGGRDAVRGHSARELQAQLKSNAQLATAICTDSWYHAAAIEEDEKDYS